MAPNDFLSRYLRFFKFLRIRSVDRAGHVHYRQVTPTGAQLRIGREISKNLHTATHFVINAPTGVGKQFVGQAIAYALGSAYLLTSTKMLQDQYQRIVLKSLNIDEYLGNVVGKLNYRCNIWPELSAASAPCVALSDLRKSCRKARHCDWFRAIEKAEEATAYLSNYAFFLYSRNCGVLKTVDGTPPFRKAVIMDEAHDLTELLVSHATTLIDFRSLLERFGIDINVHNSRHLRKNKESFSANRDILKELFKRIAVALESEKEHFDEFCKTLGVDATRPKQLNTKVLLKLKKLTSNIEALDKIYKPLERFMDNPDPRHWIIERTGDTGSTQMKLQPLDVSSIFQESIQQVGSKFFYLSATFLDPVSELKGFGIAPEDVCVIDVESPFGHHRSPIVIRDAGRMTRDDFQQSISGICAEIVKILDVHSKSKGIIHTGSYKIATEIFTRLQTSTHASRLLIDPGKLGGPSKTNQELVNDHISDLQPTVLISPSMETGVSLDHDLARFQIIAKIPFPSLADRRVVELKRRNQDWYLLQTAAKLVQAAGRATRSETDWSITYIIDSSYAALEKLIGNRFPREFRLRRECGRDSELVTSLICQNSTADQVSELLRPSLYKKPALEDVLKEDFESLPVFGKIA